MCLEEDRYYDPRTSCANVLSGGGVFRSRAGLPGPSPPAVYQQPNTSARGLLQQERSRARNNDAVVTVHADTSVLQDRADVDRLTEAKLRSLGAPGGAAAVASRSSRAGVPARSGGLEGGHSEISATGPISGGAGGPPPPQREDPRAPIVPAAAAAPAPSADEKTSEVKNSGPVPQREVAAPPKSAAQQCSSSPRSSAEEPSRQASTASDALRQSSSSAASADEKLQLCGPREPFKQASVLTASSMPGGGAAAASSMPGGGSRKGAPAAKGPLASGAAPDHAGTSAALRGAPMFGSLRGVGGMPFVSPRLKVSRANVQTVLCLYK